MNRLLLAVLFFVIAFSSHPSPAADSPGDPFQSVLVRDDTIIATLPAEGARWLIDSGSSSARLSEHGETFTLRAGETLRFVERHSSYSYTAQLTPTPGLQVTPTVDARSVGGATTDKTFFIPAR